MHYYLYQITCLVNNKIYVGVHKTHDLNDGYMGSGKVIKAAFAKHGANNFTKVILETFDTSEAMYAREKEVVTDEFLAREDTYNLRRGGTGGFDYINKNLTDEQIQKRCKAGYLAMENKLTDQQKYERSSKGGLANSKKIKECGVAYNKKFTENARMAARSNEAIKKKKETFAAIKHQQGVKNSQYGKPRSDETKKKISNSLKKKYNSTEPKHGALGEAVNF